MTAPRLLSKHSNPSNSRNGYTRKAVSSHACFGSNGLKLRPYNMGLSGQVTFMFDTRTAGPYTSPPYSST